MISTDLCQHDRLLLAAVLGECCRCETPIKGFAAPYGSITSGYYIASVWADYCNPNEIYVCDACMRADRRYKAIYGGN